MVQYINRIDFRPCCSELYFEAIVQQRHCIILTGFTCSQTIHSVNKYTVTAAGCIYKILLSIVVCPQLVTFSLSCCLCTPDRRLSFVKCVVLSLCIYILQSVIQSPRSSFLVALGKDFYAGFC